MFKKNDFLVIGLEEWGGGTFLICMTFATFSYLLCERSFPVSDHSRLTSRPLIQGMELGTEVGDVPENIQQVEAAQQGPTRSYSTAERPPRSNFVYGDSAYWDNQI